MDLKDRYRSLKYSTVISIQALLYFKLKDDRQQFYPLIVDAQKNHIIQTIVLGLNRIHDHFFISEELQENKMKTR